TANQVPNIIYDIVLGGALTGAIVPVLAGAAAHRSAYHPVVKSRAGAVPSGDVPAGPGPSGNGAGPSVTGAPPAGDGGCPADAPLTGADAAQLGADGAGPRAEAEANQIASALLTWAVVLLAPASLIIALIARPLASLLLAGVPHCSQAAAVSVSSRML